jgi:hypothetical protein
MPNSIILTRIIFWTKGLIFVNVPVPSKHQRNPCIIGKGKKNRRAAEIAEETQRTFLKTGFYNRKKEKNRIGKIGFAGRIGIR